MKKGTSKITIKILALVLALATILPSASMLYKDGMLGNSSIVMQSIEEGGKGDPSSAIQNGNNEAVIEEVDLGSSSKNDATNKKPNSTTASKNDSTSSKNDSTSSKNDSTSLKNDSSSVKGESATVSKDNATSKDETLVLQNKPSENKGGLVSSMSDGAISYAANGDPDYVILAGSDFQSNDTSIDNAAQNAWAASKVKDILAKVPNKNQIGAVLFGGDYTITMEDSSASTTANAVLDNALTEGGVSSTAERFYNQGNHEPAGLSFVNATGGYDREDYGVYVINEDDYNYGAQDSAKVKATANALKTWLDTQAVGSKPIFVMSHIPLHYSRRTRNGGDAQYAKYIVDVLNAAGQRGLNIIFLFGHNHSGGYDAYLGGATNYIGKGGSLWISDTANKTAVEEKTINFTYMNYGYVGYYEGVTGSDDKQTMTLFNIYGDDVEIRRYSADGLHPVKATTGVWANQYDANEHTYGFALNTQTYASPLTVKGSDLEVNLPASFGETGLSIGAFATVSVDTANGCTYKWESSDNGVVGVTDNGDGTATVYGSGKGVAKIRVTETAQNGAIKYTEFYVRVSDIYSIESGKVYYKLVDKLTPGKKYIIADSNKAGATEMLKAAGTGANATQQSAKISVYGSGVPYIAAPSDSTGLIWNYSDENENGFGKLSLESNEAPAVATTTFTWEKGKLNGGSDATSGLLDTSDSSLKYYVSTNSFYKVSDFESFAVANTYDVRYHLYDANYTYLTCSGWLSGTSSFTTADMLSRNNKAVYFKIAGRNTDQTKQLSSTVFVGVTGTYKNVAGGVGLLAFNATKNNDPSKYDTYAYAKLLDTPTNPTAYRWTYKENIGLYADFAGNSGEKYVLTHFIQGNNKDWQAVSAIDPNYYHRAYIYEEAPLTYTLALSDEDGVVAQNAANDAQTGTMVVKTWSTGLTEYIPVTVEMLSKGTATAGTFNQVTVIYDGHQLSADYTLTVGATKTIAASGTYYRLTNEFVSGKNYLIVNTNKAGSGVLMESAKQDSSTHEPNMLATEVMVGLDSDGVPAIKLNSNATKLKAQTWNYYYHTSRQSFHLYQDGPHTAGWSVYVAAPSNDGGILKREDSSSQALTLNTITLNTSSSLNNYTTIKGSTYTGGIAMYIEYDEKQNAFVAVRDINRTPGNEVYIYEEVNYTTAQVSHIGETGKVAIGSNTSAKTGTHVLITYPDGKLELVPVTVAMLKQNGSAVNTTTITEHTRLTNLTLTYNNVVLTNNYVLDVQDAVSKDYPVYPEPGSVRVDKKANTADYTFDETGVARVDLSTSGIPANAPLDVLAIIDTSSSVEQYRMEDGTTRLEAMREAVKELIDVLGAPNADGTAPDINLAISQFNDFTYFKDNNTLKNDNPAGERGFPAEDNQILQDYTNITEMGNFNTGLLQPHSGTNYDVAFQVAYEAVAARRAAYPDREQIVKIGVLLGRRHCTCKPFVPSFRIVSNTVMT